MSSETAESLLIDQLPNWVAPLVWVGVGGALATGLLFVLYIALRLFSPKLAAIAHTSAKEGWSQPLFWVEVVVGSFLLLLFAFIPYNTFGEDVKVLKDSALSLIMVLGIVQAVWNASVSISDEIEGRTALTLLSKPISRRQFILGKFLGVLAPVYTTFLVLGCVFLCIVSYKVHYDARETANVPPDAIQCLESMIQIVPGLVLAFFETMMLAAISVAISTRLPMLPNLVISAAIYVLGHLAPILVQSTAGKLELVRFVAQFFAVILPQLEQLNVSAAIATEAQVPWTFVGLAFLYAVLYSTVAMLLALILFEERDLA